MAHTSKLFETKPVDLPNRSGFDLSHENLLTMKVGTLTPVLCEEVIPNETYSLGSMAQIQLPPMATDFFGRVDFRMEAFFVPNRIVWQGWQNFWTMPVLDPYSSTSIRPTKLPSLSAAYDSVKSGALGRGTLADYLGIKTNNPTKTGTYIVDNLLPFLAYHKIYDDWYRNTKIQKPVFQNRQMNASAPVIGSPWYPQTYSVGVGTLLNDGVAITSLRQRNWAKDYFTTCATYPDAYAGSNDGVSSSVNFTVDTESGDGSISIPAIRSANVLQRWAERNNIAGERYADQIKAQYGVLPSDAIMDRAIFLGSTKFGIYNKSVYQTNQGDTKTSQNLFNSVGSKGGSSMGIGDDTLINSFTATEHGYIIVLASIVPHAYYTTGVRKLFRRSQVGDFAIPLLQGLGEQLVYKSELVGLPNSSEKDDMFGYQQQYSEYKYHDDEVHGLLADGQSLDAYCLQRSFDDSVGLNTDFIQIKTDAMDQVTAVAADLSKYGAWADIYFSFKKVSPLSEYVIPTLGDLRNTHKEDIPYRGRML